MHNACHASACTSYASAWHGECIDAQSVPLSGIAVAWDGGGSAEVGGSSARGDWQGGEFRPPNF